MKPSAPARTRSDDYEDAPLGSPPEKGDRVEYMADLMAAGRYTTRVTVRALEKKWGISWKILQNDASEASRLFHLDPAQRAEYQSQVRAALEAIRDQAMSTPNLITGQPDFKAAIQALELAAKYAGIRLDGEPGVTERAPTKIVITGDDDDEQPGADGAGQDDPARGPAT